MVSSLKADALDVSADKVFVITEARFQEDAGKLADLYGFITLRHHESDLIAQALRAP
jgi:hypothetical protein